MKLNDNSAMVKIEELAKKRELELLNQIEDIKKQRDEAKAEIER